MQMSVPVFIGSTSLDACVLNRVSDNPGLDVGLLKWSQRGVFVGIFVFPSGVWSPQSVCLRLRRITCFVSRMKLSDRNRAEFAVFWWPTRCLSKCLSVGEFMFFRTREGVVFLFDAVRLVAK